MTESRGTYARERARLTEAHRKRADVLIAGDKIEGRGLDLVDTVCAGLVLRVTRRGASWLLKHRAGTVKLGDVDTLPVASARIAADRARVAVQDGKTTMLATDLQVFSVAHERGADTETAVDAAFPELPREQTEEERRADGPWEWGDLIDLYLAHKLPTLRPRWASQFEKHLRRAVGDLARRLVTDVGQEDLLRVRNRVAEERTLSAAADTIEAVKAALDWGKRQEPVLSGLGTVAYPWWREGLHVDWSSGTREHTPTLEELAKTILLAERHRSLGGTRKETDNATLAALWALVLTGQRVSALTGTQRSTSRDWPERPGWRIWTWTAAEMKGPGGGGRARRKPRPKPHGLPVPPEALEVLARYPVQTKSKHLFPRDPDKSITPAALTGLFDRLKGKSKGARKGKVTVRPEGDLLAANSIRHWTPHDVRRTLGTFLDLERLGGAGSAILSHARTRAAGGADEERELAAAITLRHYIHSQRIELKAEGMSAWVAAVLEAYEREKAAAG